MERYTIAQARMLSGFTQVEMAEKLGMAEATYIKYEKNRSVFRMDTAEQFANEVGLPSDRIIFFTPQVRINRIKEEA